MKAFQCVRKDIALGYEFLQIPSPVTPYSTTLYPEKRSNSYKSVLINVIPQLQHQIFSVVCDHRRAYSGRHHLLWETSSFSHDSVSTAVAWAIAVKIMSSIPFGH